MGNECALCPNNWRFLYAYYTALKYTKYDQEYLPKIYESKTIDDIPENIRLEFNGRDVDFLYIDDQIAIFHDVERDDMTHLLVMPIKHIETFDIFKYPDLLKIMLCASKMIVDFADLEEATLSISTKSNSRTYVPHFHSHIKSSFVLDHDKLKDMLYPEFYKDSLFY